MFWKYNFGSSAQIETLLQKEDVTLFELMDENELLQECKAQNKKLIDFLTRAEILDELVCLVVNEPAVDGELKMRFKYANLAAELLTADVPAIIDKLVTSTNLLEVLYKFLEKEKPLNPLMASFFSKVLGMLMQRRSEQNWYSYQFTCFQVLDFLKSKGDFVELAVQHVGTSAIMDLLLKLICNVEEEEIRQSVHQWLSESQLVERLVERLSPDADAEEHTSADNLLCEISISCRDFSCEGQQQSSPLLMSLESEDTVNKLLDLLLHENRTDSSLSHVINILLTLLSARPLQQHMQQPQQQQGLQQSSSLESSDSDSSDGRKNAVARTIAKRLPSFQSILLHPPKKGLIQTAYGQEVEPLGSTRLQVVTLVSALVTVNDPIVHNALFELNTIEYLLDLFFKFMLNNFLHTQVVQCLISILTKAPAPSSPQEDSDHRLLSQLFTEGRIIERIVTAFEETSEGVEGKHIHNLKGYMGHLRQVANTIVQQAEFGPNEHRIKQLIQDLPGDLATQWDDFVSNTLAELNRKNEIIPVPVLGMHHLDSAEDSDDDSHFSSPHARHSHVFKEWLQDVSGNCLGGGHVWGLTSVPDDHSEGDDLGNHTEEKEEVVEEREEEREGEEEEDFTAADHILSQDIHTFRHGGKSKGYKEMDMDVIGEFRYADDEFKDPDDNLSGPLQRLTTQALGLSGVSGMGGIPGGAQEVEGGGEGGVAEDRDLFEEMCSHRRNDLREFDDMWSDKEKEITFTPAATQSDSLKESHSSSDEEDEDDEFAGIRTDETKMEVDQDGVQSRRMEKTKEANEDWAEVFDNRAGSNKAEENEPVNPWQSAPMSDTSDNSGWADFGSNPFASGANPFGPPIRRAEPQPFPSDFSANFGSVMTQENSANAVIGETASNQEAFKADFSNVNFNAGFEDNCDDKTVVASTGNPQSSFLSSRGLLKNSEEVGGNTGCSEPIAGKSGSSEQAHPEGAPVAESVAQS